MPTEQTPSTEPTSGRPWLDTDRPVEERVEALLSEMTLAEKVGQLHQTANIDPEEDAALIRSGGISSSLYASGATGGNIKDEGLLSSAIDTAQRIAVEESRLGIPLLFGRDVIHGHRTVFPIPLGLASAWDESLVERTCEVAADEAHLEGVAWTFAPMVDISEEPRWGRVAESFGEQPVLSGRLAAAAVRGFQGEPRGAKGRLAACAKHFVGYGLAAGGRDYDTVSVGENTLRNMHLRPFKAAVDAGVSTVMASFNDVDGVPMHSNRRLVREVLKDEWGFDGVVVGDWGGVGQLTNHGVAADLREAAVYGIEAGIDLDMVSGAYSDHLAELVESGEVALELVDDAVRRVLRLKLRLGLFERPYTGTPERSNAPTTDTRALAREAAHGSMVLLSNNGVLPLPAEPGKLLLTGPFAQEGEALLGTWVLDGRGEDVISPETAFRERLGDKLLVQDGRFSERGVQMVREADVTVAVVGEHPWRSGEANSVSRIGLPAGQLEVLHELAGIGKPLVVVVYSGRPLELGPVLDLADAVILAWHPGVEAGNALADVVFGDTAPRGRLPMTFPRSTGHIPTSTHQRPTSRTLAPEEDRTQGRYLDALVLPRLPFGFGLTYTTFSYGEVTLSATELPRNGGSVEVSVEVTNTGDRAGREVVQLYFRDPVAQVTRPNIELADWVSLELEPGQAGTARFSVDADQFGYFGRDLTRRVDTGEVVLVVGPDASRGRRAGITVTD